MSTMSEQDPFHPINRPENSEVDNNHRVFDAGSGYFTDHPDYDPSHRPFAKAGSDAPPRTEPQPERFGPRAWREGTAQGQRQQPRPGTFGQSY